MHKQNNYFQSFSVEHRLIFYEFPKSGNEQNQGEQLKAKMEPMSPEEVERIAQANRRKKEVREVREAEDREKDSQEKKEPTPEQLKLEKALRASATKAYEQTLASLKKGVVPPASVLAPLAKAALAVKDGSKEGRVLTDEQQERLYDVVPGIFGNVEDPRIGNLIKAKNGDEYMLDFHHNTNTYRIAKFPGGKQPSEIVLTVGPKEK